MGAEKLIGDLLKALSNPIARDTFRKTLFPDESLDLKDKDQKIRRTSTGYIVTLNTFSSASGNSVEVEEVYEEKEGSTALEDALASLIQEIGGDDADRVLAKLYKDKE